MRKYLSYIIGTLLISVIVLGVLPSHEVKAVDADNWNHVIPFTITDTSGVDRTYVPVIISYDTDGKLVAYGLTNSTCTNTYVDSSGASNSPIGNGTAYNYLMESGNITCVIPSLPAYGSVTINLYTGYNPVQTSFPIITGNGGYYTVADDADLEDSENITIAFEDTYINTDSGEGKYLVDKYEEGVGGIRSYVSTELSGNITTRIYYAQGTQYLFPNAAGWQTNITGASPAVDHYLNVDDQVAYPDDATTYVSIAEAGASDWYDDSYNLTSPVSWNGTYQKITAVKVYFRHYATGVNYGQARPNLYLNGTAVTGTGINTTNAAWTTSSESLSRPGGGTWTTADFENLQAGVGLKTLAGSTQYCTQAYVKVEYDYGEGINVDDIETGEYDVEIGLYNGVYSNLVDYGSILHYDGTANSYVDCGDNYTSSPDLWVAIWFELDNDYAAGSGDVYLWGIYDDASNNIALSLRNSSGKLYFGQVLGGVDGASLSSTQTSWDADTLYFAYCQIDNYGGGIQRLKIDDGSIITGNLTSLNTPSSGNFTIGNNRPNVTSGVVAHIHNVIVSRVAISTVQINQLYNGVIPTDATSFYLLDEGSGTIATDYGTDDFDGTIGTACTWATGDRYTDAYLDIDGTKWGINLHGNAFPDNSTDWTFCTANTTPYAGAVKITVDDTQQAWYQPNALISGTTLPDRQSNGGSNDGTIVWGSNSDITVTGGSIMDSESATSVGVTSAMMQGELFYLGTYSSVYMSFQYGLDTNYGYSTSETSAAVEQTHSVTLTGLTPNTTYHFRAIARNGVVYSYGADTTFTTAFSTASEGSTTPLIENVGVFSSYQDDDDLLFCAEIVLTYPPYYPTDISYKYFQMQLIDTDGTTILGASPISQWGDRPTSIYLNSTVASGLTYGEEYEIRVTNISTENISISTSETLEAGDWYGADKNNLDSWCIGVAMSMQNTDGTLLTDPYLRSVTERGLIITNTAGGFFTTGIPNIAEVRPALFTTGVVKSGRDTLSGTTSYNPTADIEDELGSTIVTDAGTVGTVFNITGEQFLLYTILAVVLLCVVYTVSKTQGFGALGATILTIPIIGASAYFHVMNIALPVIGVVLLVWLFVRQFVWKTM